MPTRLDILEQKLDKIIAMLGGAQSAKTNEMVNNDRFTFFDEGKSMEQMYKENPEYFYNIVWYKNESFFKEISLPKQMTIRREPKKESFCKTRDEQLNQLLPGESIPTAREVMAGIIAYHKNTGDWIMAKYGRTSSRTDDRGRVPGEFVCVGNADVDGAYVGAYDPSDSGPHLGSCLSR